MDAQIEAHLAPFADTVARLDDIPGIGPTAAALIIGEIGTDMTGFPTSGHLCSWAKFAPGIKSSAGKNKGNGSIHRDTATVTWPGSSARPPPALPAPTPSSAHATDASPDAAARRRRWSRSAAPMRNNCSWCAQTRLLLTNSFTGERDRSEKAV